MIIGRRFSLDGLRWLGLVLITAAGCSPRVSDAPSEGGSEGGSDGGGSTGARLVIAAEMELCANSHIAAQVPESFARFAMVSIPAGEHALPAFEPFRIDLETGQGPLPLGKEIDLGATIAFPNVSGGDMFSFSAGTWALIADRANDGGDAPGMAWLFQVAAPEATAAPLSRARLRLQIAEALEDGVMNLAVPTSERELDDFEASVACPFPDQPSCSLGGVEYPGGLVIDLVPCASAGPATSLVVDTMRGSFEFTVESLRRSGESTPGIGLLRRASGVLDGVEFAQTQLSALSMASGGRSIPGYGEQFGVRFDAPIGSACGALVENLEFEPSYPLDPLGRIAYLIDCEGERGPAIEVSAYAWQE